MRIFVLENAARRVVDHVVATLYSHCGCVVSSSTIDVRHHSSESIIVGASMKVSPWKQKKTKETKRGRDLRRAKRQVVS
jgi:hypothetical protein